MTVQDTTTTPEEVAYIKTIFVEPEEETEYRNQRHPELTTITNLMAIKRMYNDSYSGLKNTLKTLQIDLKLNPNTIIDIDKLINDTQNKLMNAFDILEISSKINTFVNIEYTMFQEYLSNKRTQTTLFLTEALYESTQSEQMWRDKYNLAALEFKQKEEQNEFSFVSATGSCVCFVALCSALAKWN